MRLVLEGLDDRGLRAITLTEMQARVQAAANAAEKQLTPRGPAAGDAPAASLRPDSRASRAQPQDQTQGQTQTRRGDLI